jgi:drug/metabolite transporter (DMT)-like permease
MTLTAQGLAACAATLFAASHVASKRGVQTTSVEGGLLVSLSVSLLTLMVAAVIERPSALSVGSILVFAAAGLFGPGLGRAAAVVGVDRLGPSVSVPIQASSYPAIAVLTATLVLHEDITIYRLAGCLAIVIGVWALTRRSDEPAAPDLEGLVSAPPKDSPIWHKNALSSKSLKRAFAFPIIAGLGYGIADIIRKSGLNDADEPILGALIGVATVLVVWLAAVLASPAMRRRVTWGRTAGWFALSGFFASLALIAQFNALTTGDVSVVSPIIAAQPLAVLLLSAIFLGGIERLTARSVAGGTTIVLGAVLVSI